VKENGKNHTLRRRTPFWLPATGFYFLVFGVAVGTFFFVILIFHDGGNEVEIVSSGLAASGVLIFGVILREVVFRGVRGRYIERQRMLDMNLGSVPTPSGEYSIGRKFTLEQNATALEAIKQKSDAAKVFGRISEGHREVFELCAEYRQIVNAEIPKTHPESPRLKAMIRGRRKTGELQQYHLLRWAEIESKRFAEKAVAAISDSERSEFAEKARGILQFALGYYPEDPRLVESARFLDMFEASNGSKPGSEHKGDRDVEIS